jgi:hypothetical protein
MQGLFLFTAAVAKPMLIVFLSTSALVGLLAMVSPRAFAAAIAKGNVWIDTWRFFPSVDNKVLRKLDRWVDLDHVAVRCGRLTGAVMFAAGAALAWLLWMQ